MEETKKLKRGLKDISPLFDSKSQDVKDNSSVATQKGIYCLNIFSRDLQGDSLFVSTYLASRLAVDIMPCSIISIVPSYLSDRHTEKTLGKSESFGHHVKRFSMTWPQFETIWEHGFDKPDFKENGPQIIFLDFEYLSVPHFDKVIPVLDKWIAVVKPTLESVTETYKVMKAMASLNHHLEYYLIFDGVAGDERASMLYEQFSELASRRLGLTIGWLGSLNLTRSGKQFSSELALDHLFMGRPEGVDSVEKRMLADMIHDWPEHVHGVSR